MSTPSLRKASEAGSITDKDLEKVDVSEIPDVSPEDKTNVGLREFALAKEAGLRVTPEVSKR